jgi:hypothetical protein
LTKTTNYEISKKLKEIGFDKETNFYFTEVAPDKFEAQYYTNNKEYLLLKSYDLETILDALPKNISKMGHVYPTGYHLNINFSQLSTISYIEDDLHSLRDNHPVFVEKRENETLADTAARLLILLHEKNLIKF